ncbi:MAG: hypothetical protein ACI33P_08550 [Lysinibacillus sp.]
MAKGWAILLVAGIITSAGFVYGYAMHHQQASLAVFLLFSVHLDSADGMALLPYFSMKKTPLKENGGPMFNNN